MKSSIMLCLSLFCWFGHGIVLFHYQDSKQDTTSDLEERKASIEKIINTLTFTLTHENTDEQQQIEIIDTLSQSPVSAGQITSALEEIVARGTFCEDKENQEDCFIKGTSSLIAQLELMKRHTEALLKAEQENLDIFLNAVLVITGIGILAIPLVGPPLLITAGSLLGGSAVTGIGLYRVGQNLEFIGTQQNVFELVKTVALQNMLAQVIFQLAKSGDSELTNRVILSSNEGQVVDIFYDIVSNENSSYSSETRSVAIEALSVFPNELRLRRKSIFKLLTGFINDKGEELGLRISAVKTLGVMGVKVSGIQETLRIIAEKEDNEDELQLFAFFEWGRSETSFDASVDELGKWLRKRREDESPVQILKIPDYYPKFLLESKGITKEHITVLREFIQTEEILSFKEKLKYSATLVDWDKNNNNSKSASGKTDEEPFEESKTALSNIYQEPFMDINSYFDELDKEGLFEVEDGEKALSYLQINLISEIENTKNYKEVLQIMDTAIKDFKIQYSKQTEISKNLEEFFIFYKKIIEFIKNKRFNS